MKWEVTQILSKQKMNKKLAFWIIELWQRLDCRFFQNEPFVKHVKWNFNEAFTSDSAQQYGKLDTLVKLSLTLNLKDQ